MADLYDEISEELRTEQFNQFLKDNYKALIALVIFVLVAAGVYSWWQKHNQQQQMAATSSLLQAADSGKNEDLQNVAKTAPVNQATLADMVLAGQYLDQNKPDQALEIYQRVAASGAPKFWRDTAKFNAASIQSNKNQLDDAIKTLSPLLEKDNAWRPMALELKASIEAKQGNNKSAFEDYAELSTLQTADEAARGRARQLMRYYQP